MKDKTSITNLTRLQQFHNESVTDFISRWTIILTSKPYTLPQEELVKMFIQRCLRPIASTLLIQQHKTFEEAIFHVVIIEKVKIQDSEIKGNKKEPYVKNKNQME